MVYFLTYFFLLKIIRVWPYLVFCFPKNSTVAVLELSLSLLVHWGQLTLQYFFFFKLFLDQSLLGFLKFATNSYIVQTPQLSTRVKLFLCSNEFMSELYSCAKTLQIPAWEKAFWMKLALWYIFFFQNKKNCWKNRYIYYILGTERISNKKSAGKKVLNNLICRFYAFYYNFLSFILAAEYWWYYLGNGK